MNNYNIEEQPIVNPLNIDYTQDISTCIPITQDENMFVKDYYTKVGESCGAIPIYSKEGDSVVNPKKLPTSAACFCEMFDLSITEDRVKYANLYSKIVTNKGEMELCFVERVVVPSTGQLLIYMMYNKKTKIIN